MAWNRPLVGALVVSALVLLTLYPTTETNGEARPGVRLLEVQGLNLTSGERFETPFEVPDGLASLNLSYHFEVAIYPEVWWRDPDGRAYHAVADDAELDLTVAWPQGGLWSFHIQPDPDRNGSVLEGADVTVIGFLPQDGQASATSS